VSGQAIPDGILKRAVRSTSYVTSSAWLAVGDSNQSPELERHNAKMEECALGSPYAGQLVLDSCADTGNATEYLQSVAMRESAPPPMPN